jgi:hypothetical protein
MAHSRVDHLARGCELPELEEERGRGHEGGHHAGPGHGRDAFVRNLDEMVGRAGAEFGGERRAARVVELVGVDPQGEPRVRGRTENAPALVDGEDAAFAEHVGELGQTKARDLGNGDLDHLLDVALAVGAAIERHLVRAEVGAHDSHRVVRSRPR